MNRVVYLGGAMSCYFNTEQADYPKQWRKEAKEYANKLYEGMTLIAPTDFYGIGENYNKTEAEAMRFDLRMVRESDVLLVDLKNLNTSLGTSDEILYAFIKGIPIIGFLEDDPKANRIHPWKIEQIDRIETGEGSMKRAIDYIYEYYVCR